MIKKEHLTVSYKEVNGFVCLIKFMCYYYKTKFTWKYFFFLLLYCLSFIACIIMIQKHAQKEQVPSQQEIQNVTNNHKNNF
jgi:hypothetical protein